MENKINNITPIGICTIECIDAILQRLIRCSCITFELAVKLREVMIDELPYLENKLIKSASEGNVSIYDIRKAVSSHFECIIPSYVDVDSIKNTIYWINEISGMIDLYTTKLVEIGFVDKADSLTLNQKLEENIMLIEHFGYHHSNSSSISNHKLVFGAINKMMFFIVRFNRRIYGYVDDNTITGDRFFVKQLESAQRNEYIKELHELGINKTNLEILFNVSRSTVRRVLK